MRKISVVQIGLGPLGRKISEFISERPSFQIVGAVDKDPQLAGKKLREICAVKDLDVPIRSTLEEVIQEENPDIAVLSTVSDLPGITPQLEDILSFCMSVVSTCEELCYPWNTYPELSARLDQAARASNVAILGTGVNPGFLMDTLPLCLTAVSQKVDAVRVSRIQNAAFRRLSFQRKIGAGLSLAQFEEKEKTGALRHVGLTESMHMIAARLGWKLDRTEDALSPVVAQSRIVTESMTIEAGQAAGVQQIGRGFAGKEEKITLLFRASVGEPDPEDTVEILGTPPIVSTIKGGINGDVATCALTLNALPRVLQATPGLKTMIDIPPLSYFV